MDSKKTAKKIYGVSEYRKWIKRPGSGDIRGVDTKVVKKGNTAKKSPLITKKKQRKMELTAEDIFEYLEKSESKGRVDIEGGLVIKRMSRKKEYNVYHDAIPRDVRRDVPIRTFTTIKQLKKNS